MRHALSVRPEIRAGRRHRRWWPLMLLAAVLQGCGGGSGEPKSADPASSLRRAAASTTGVDGGSNEALAGTRHLRGMGMNLSSFDYWSTEFPTIDQFKRAGGWFTSCDTGVGSCTFTDDDKKAGKSGWDTLEQARLDLDENGWVRSLPDADDTRVKYRFVSAILFDGDQGAHPAGTYTVLYDGKGEIEYSGGSNLRRGTGRDQMDLSDEVGSQLVVRIRSIDERDPIRHIRVIPPGGVCSQARRVYVREAADCVAAGSGDFITLEALSATQVWHPLFLADLKGVRALRFMDWARTNNSQLASWADRPLKTDAFWTGPHGVPVSAMVNLANALQADAWINLPPKVDDEYARRLALLIKSTLDAKAQLILEYANEPWNWAFPTSHWMREQAMLRWPDKMTGPPPAYADLSWEASYSWYGMRAAQLCRIVKAQFGAEAARVKCVTNAQAADPWTAQQQLDCPYALADTGGVRCREAFDAVSIASYFGNYISGQDYREQIVTTWFTQPDGGLGKLFEELRARNASDQPVEPPLAAITRTNGDADAAVGGAVGQSARWMMNYKAQIADSGNYGLPIYSYEGGQHLVNGVRRDCLLPDGRVDEACLAIEDEFAARWQPLFIRANRDPLMGRAYTEMMDHWRTAYGQVFMPFNYAGSFSQYGAWGLKETVFKTAAESPKWSALLPYKDSVACWWTDCTK